MIRAGDVATSLTASTATLDRSTASRSSGRPDQLGQQQKVFDEMGHPLGLGLHPVHRVLDGVGVVAHSLRKLGIATDRRQRGAQLMAGVGERNRTHPGLAGLARRQGGRDVVEHPVERRPELPSFRARLASTQAPAPAARLRRGPAANRPPRLPFGATRRSGASARRMITMPAVVAAASAMTVTTAKISRTRIIVASTPAVGRPVMTTSPSAAPAAATTCRREAIEVSSYRVPVHRQRVQLGLGSGRSTRHDCRRWSDNPLRSPALGNGTATSPTGWAGASRKTGPGPAARTVNGANAPSAAR